MIVREGRDNELLPTVLREGKPVTEFEQDFFLVSLAHGQPKKNNDFSILKHYDFPPLNRLDPPTVSCLDSANLTCV